MAETSERWSLIKRIFQDALEREPGETDAFLDAACSGDHSLRQEVDSLLRAFEEAGSYLDGPLGADELPTLGPDDVPDDNDELPGQIGPYKILSLLGEGGMGSVYLAEQSEPFQRRVAIKIIKLGMDTKEVVARFESERQALALMNHPNIAKVFDAGSTEAGRPYFVMEYIAGIPINKYCDEQRVSTRDRLAMFQRLCRAVQHAHQKGIIHRDLKPSNVLVTLEEGTAVPKVIDFGVAKAISQTLTRKTLFTEQGRLIGTPEYMSPEQAETTQLDVDATSDIYSLGVILYELLVGALPFDPKTLRQAAWDEMRRIIREDDPPTPSTRLSGLGHTAEDVADRRRTNVVSLQRRLRGDLDWVVMKAIEKDRTRRYGSASEFAADIERHLTDEPVLARPPSATYRLRKLAARHKVPVFAAAAIIATVAILGSVALWMGVRALQQARRTQAMSVLMSAAAADDALLGALLLLEIEDRPGLPGGASVAHRIATRPIPTAVLRHDSVVWDIAFSPDGSKILTAAGDSLARIWSVDGGDPLILRGHTSSVLVGAFSPDGRRVVTGSADRRARVWATDGSGTPVILGGHEDAVTEVLFNHDATLVITITEGYTARLWRVEGPEQIAILGSNVDAAAFAPDGKSVWTFSGGSVAHVGELDAAGNLAEMQQLDEPANGVIFAPDGVHLITSSLEGTGRTWRHNEAEDPVPLAGPVGRVVSTTASGEEAMFAATSGDNVARVWRIGGNEPDQPPPLPGFDVDEPTEETITVRVREEGPYWPSGAIYPDVFSGHEALIRHAALSPDGSRLVTVSNDSARLWRVDFPHETSDLLGGHIGVITDVDFSPRGDLAATAGADGTVRLWNMAPIGHPVALGTGRSLRAAAFSSDGARVVIADSNGVARVWGADGSGDPVVLSGHENHIDDVALSADGSLVATASRDGTARVWRADGSGDPILLFHDARVNQVSFSPDASRVATMTENGTIRVWRADVSSLPIFPTILGEVNDLLIDDDGNLIARDRADEARALRSIRERFGEGPNGNFEPWQSAEFSPDGNLVVTTHPDGTARIWRADGAGDPIVLLGHEEAVWSAGFSPDSRLVVTQSFDDTARIWPIDGSSEPIVVPSGATDTVLFSPDSAWLLTEADDADAHLWRVSWSGLIEHLRSVVGECLTARQRMGFLGESSAAAREGFAACELSHGRTP